MKELKDTPTDVMPLNKYIALAGVCSRRNAVELIAKGYVKVNDKTVKEPGFKVGQQDVVKVKNKQVRVQEHIYIVLNKPQGVVTTVRDEKGRLAVVDLIKLPKDKRVYPIGRLDVNTTGVLLLTNDGALAQQLAHPSYQVAKVYDVTLHRAIDEETVDRINKGVRIDNIVIRVDDYHLISSAKNNKIRVTIHSGQNRIVRRLFEHLGYIIEKLDRISFAGISKKGLSLGHWRMLRKAEVAFLKNTMTKRKSSTR